ncbi:hypothetical protein FNV43_RR18420 [Rhamnella rubrinervis]|uniref:Uncharacterized protein n=1 Tax=Rhamnella rubrinervis TaxID=2594499 RepID=A0A8K0GSX2_9ROSA|nr:hypothetical protein FNV43_RR18420 [Rhamnella rubrinervis]
MERKMMMIKAMECKSVVLRRALLESSCGYGRKSSLKVPPVRGGIKRKILALVCKKLKLATQYVLHFLLISNCNVHSDQVRIINIVLPQQNDNGNARVVLEG